MRRLRLGTKLAIVGAMRVHTLVLLLPLGGLLLPGLLLRLAR